MLLMRANPLRGQLEGGWELEIQTFLGPVKWHRTVLGECHFGPKKVMVPGPNHLPLDQVMDFSISKTLRTWPCINQRSIGSFMFMSFCILGSVFCICILYSVFCILYSVFCILYSVPH
jgi:hypothetical protein